MNQCISALFFFAIIAAALAVSGDKDGAVLFIILMNIWAAAGVVINSVKRE